MGAASFLAMAKAPAVHSFDFCQFQRFVNNTFGSNDYPSFPTTPARPGDRLTQYGFDLADGPCPDYAGVYAIVSRAYVFGPHVKAHDHLLYIGSAKNIRKRLNGANHPIKKFRRMNCLLFVLYKQTNDYMGVEKSLIKCLRPWFNIQHNG